MFYLVKIVAIEYFIHHYGVKYQENLSIVTEVVTLFTPRNFIDLRGLKF